MVSKSEKRLYMFFQISNVTNDDFQKKFDVYVKAMKFYILNMMVQPILVKTNLSEM